MIRRFTLLPICLLTPTLVLLPAVLLAQSTAQPAAARVDFDRQIQPILSGRCVACHGQDQAESGLRLTSSAAVNQEQDSGAVAIVPGRPEQSELLRRVASQDADQRMPPTGPALSDEQIELLRQWIRQGADWPAHWAYRPLAPPPVPKVAGGEAAAWARSPIDQFILQRLQANQLQPSPPAVRRTLARRLYFDLLGLPPSPEQLEQFLQDESIDAYERLVDRVLASPHYGERWARHWMDIVHYAETHGHDQDRPRDHAWPYRDYLIESLNQDKPYGRFIREQIAGDVLYPGDPAAIVATGMLATGPWDESSLRDIREDTLDRQIARYIDRDDIVTTVMSTFVSSTVHCARCHDHKFDPISQGEYYGLQAVFAGIGKGNRAYDPDPRARAERERLRQSIAELPALRERLDARLLDAELQRDVLAWERGVHDAALRWQVLQPAEMHSAGGATLTRQEDGSVLSGGERPEKDTCTLVADTSLARIRGLRLEVLTDDRLPHRGPGRQDNGNLHLNELLIQAAPLDHAEMRQPVKLVNPQADFNQAGWTIAMAVDGNPATAWGIFPQVGQPHHAVFEFQEPLPWEGPTRLTIELQQTHGGGHLIGRVRLLVTDSMPPLPVETQSLPAEVAAALAVPAEQRGDPQRAALAAYRLEQRWNRELAGLPKPQLVYCGTSRFEPDGSFKPSDEPRPVHRLERGDVTKPGPLAQPAALACLPHLPGTLQLAEPGDEGQRRAALAHWIADRRNALAWRSIANRLWQYHFGRGLVETPNDFGRMGSAPSHPELLDWLACRLQQHDGSLKALHRQIVTSAVYRQSSGHDPGQAELDAENRWLWRMNRRRLDAESVRDAVLQIAGTLDRRMGGPSVKQFIQTPGIHVTPNVDYLNFDVNDPANHRRSVYRFVFRTLPDPFMDALDCPDASQLAPRRNSSVTPLQALAMLHDKVIIRQCQHLAAALQASSGDSASQVDAACLAILNRPPDDTERRALADYAARHGLSNACRVLFNSNEFLFVD
ncbi:MAG: PSD1 domain-containing protein [Pirellulaceae bacterium]|nr:PSD1 domain-containing protein [Pirellulaceae bacterium]